LKKILCLSGPNLQLLGSRQPEVYGAETLREIHARLKTRGAELGVEVTCKQSNHEGVLCDAIGSAAKSHTGILLNAAAYTHTSIALLDALLAVRLPCVEVHLSNPLRREPMRHKSYIARAAIATVSGFGGDSYLLALEGLVRHLERHARSDPKATRSGVSYGSK
jgi:3-dehydroquinate dehydratase II